jgi:hypothetical protein
MANRLQANPIYFDIFNADATLAEPGIPFIVKKIRMLSVADGDDFQLENQAGEVIFHMSNNQGGADVTEVDFGDSGFDFGRQGKGVYIDVSDCTGMAATDGTDAVWFYMV